MAHTANPSDFDANLGGDKLGTPSSGSHKSFDSVADVFAIFSKAANASNTFLHDTTGHGHTVTETGPEGDAKARDTYKKTFGAL